MVVTPKKLLLAQYMDQQQSIMCDYLFTRLAFYLGNVSMYPIQSLSLAVILY